MTNPLPLLDLERAQPKLARELQAACARVLASGRYVLGPEVANFEKELGEQLQIPHMVGVASGTDAVEAALAAVGIGPGEGVLTTPFSFVASSEAIIKLRAKPVFSDISAEDWQLDLTTASAALEALPIHPESGRRVLQGTEIKALLWVHLFGAMPPPHALLDFCERFQLKLVEDCAQACGASRDNRMAGSLGDASAFSFFPAKLLGGVGDGGAVGCKTPEQQKWLEDWRQHGGIKYGDIQTLGRNSRLDALQAAFLRVKLPHLPAWIHQRAGLLNHYTQVLTTSGSALRPLFPNPHKGHGAQLMIAKCPNRAAVRKQLQAEGIGSAVYYPLGLHQLTALRPYCLTLGPLDECEAARSQSLALPLFPGMTLAEVQRVVGACNAPLA